MVDPSWAQVPVADAENYFKAEGVTVKVVDFATGVQALQALADGQVDVTTAADVPVSAALARSTSIKVVADGARWNGSVVVGSAKAGIKKVADLAGKKIGTPLGTSAAYFGASFLKGAGIDATLVQADPSAMVTAIQKGSVDAVSIFQPFQQQVIAALGNDATILKPAPGAYVQQSLYLASNGAIRSKATALNEFFMALQKAGADLDAGKPAAISAVAKVTQLDPALVKKVLSEFDYSLEMPASLTADLTALGTWAKGAGNIASSTTLPEYSTFMTSQFLPTS